MTADNDGDFLATFMACNCPKQAYWIKNNYKNENALKILNYHSFNKAVREL